MRHVGQVERTGDIEVLSLLGSLRGDVCPACGSNKPPMQSLCRRCFHALPRVMRLALYQRFGHGYERAIQQALEHSGAPTPFFPVPQKSAGTPAASPAAARRMEGM